jgi:ribonuclease BN (tRNA processing enzyme)
MEPYQKRLLTYSGDSMPLCPEDVEGAQLLIHDATFLRRKDRDRPTHATLDEAAELARDGGCGGLVACHLSARYSVKDVRRALERLRDRGDLEIPVWFLEFKGGLRRDLHRGLPSGQDQGLGAAGSGC